MSALSFDFRVKGVCEVIESFLFHPGKNMDVLLNLNICLLSEKAICFWFINILSFLGSYINFNIVYIFNFINLLTVVN